MQSEDVRVTVLEYKKVDDPLRTVKQWVETETYWAKKIYISIDGQEKFEQIGHSDIDFYLRFSHDIDVILSGNKFKIDGKYYEAIKPPAKRGLISRKATKIAVKEVPTPDGQL